MRLVLWYKRLGWRFYFYVAKIILEAVSETGLKRIELGLKQNVEDWIIVGLRFFIFCIFFKHKAVIFIDQFA